MARHKVPSHKASVPSHPRPMLKDIFTELATMQDCEHVIMSKQSTLLITVSLFCSLSSLFSEGSKILSQCGYDVRAQNSKHVFLNKVLRRDGV